MRFPAIKILRWILIGIIVIVLLAVLLNALSLRFKQSQTIRKTPAMISSDLKQSAESLEIIERRGSDIRFRIRARHGKTRTDTSILEGVDASDFNPDGSIHYSIQSDFAKYDQVRKLVEFSGNVRMYLDKDLELRTGSLQYDLNTEIGSASGIMQWISHDITGTAQSVRFYKEKDLFELNSNVQFILKQKNMPFGSLKKPEEIHASSERAICLISQNRMIFTGKVKIESEGAGILAGEKVELVWSPDRKNIKSLTASGNAVCQFKGENESRILSGDVVAFDISPARSLERIRIIGQATLNQKTQVQDQNLSAAQIELIMDPVHNAIAAIHGQSSVNYQMIQGAQEMVLSGDILDAQFAPETKHLKKAEARGGAKFSSAGGKDMVSNDLHSEEIRAYFRELHSQASIDYLQAEGAVHWAFVPPRKNIGERQEPARTLTAAKMEVRYSSLGNYPDSGTASGKNGILVVITENYRQPSASSQIRRLSGDLIKFHFYPEKNLLKDMTAEGHVQTEYDTSVKSAEKLVVGGPIHSSSDNLSAEFAVKDRVGYLKSAAQWGNFKYWDGSYSASAGRCDYNAEEQFLVLKETPKISDERSSTSGDQIKYDLKAKMLLIRGNIRTVLSSQKNKAVFFQSSDSSSPAIILAEELRYWREEGRFRYTNGKVLSENQQLQAEILEISGRNGEHVEAQGKVHHLLSLKESPGGKTKSSRKQGTVPPSNSLTIIQSDQLKYLSKDNTIKYHGHVILISKDLNMSSDVLDGLLGQDGKNIKHVQADGNIVLRYRNRTCRGDSAEWFPESSTFTVTGNPAEIEDPEHGSSRPHRLTYFQADDRIVLEK
jgi:LPS export ABC transporter protein LptC